MRALVIAVVALAACSHERAPRVLIKSHWAAADRLCPRDVDLHSYRGATEKQLGTDQIMCWIRNEDTVLGWGVFEFQVMRGEPFGNICRIHLLPTLLRHPYSFDQLAGAIDDPLIAFQLRGLVAGIEPRRSFKRRETLDGVHVRIEQWTSSVRGSANFAYVEFELDACDQGAGVWSEDFVSGPDLFESEQPRYRHGR